jgi:hypothetical protein
MDEGDFSVISILLRSISEQKSSIELFLAGGGARSHEEYCRMVGQYSTLVAMEGEIKALEERYIEN